MPVEYQVIIIYAATKKYLLDIPVADVLAFEKDLFKYIDSKVPGDSGKHPRGEGSVRILKLCLKKAIKECKGSKIRQVMYHGNHERY